jgi:hypothetical protein
VIWHTARVRDPPWEIIVTHLVVLLAAIDERSLRAIISTVEQMPNVVPALQAWIEHAARWERDRRNGFHYPLQAPMAAIDMDELPNAVMASALIAECFRRDNRRDVAPVLAFFEGLRDTLVLEQERAGSPAH